MAAGGRCGSCRELFHWLREQGGRGVGFGRNLHVSTLIERCARFLQAGACSVDPVSRSREQSCGQLSFLGSLQGVAGAGKGGLCLAVSRAFRCIECPFTTVKRMVQGEAVIALVDGRLGVGQRQLRGSKLVGGVRAGTGGSSRVEGTLRLLNFFVWRFASAANRDGRGEAQDCQGTHARRHPWKYTRSVSAVVR